MLYAAGANRPRSFYAALFEESYLSHAAACILSLVIKSQPQELFALPEAVCLQERRTRMRSGPRGAELSIRAKVQDAPKVIDWSALAGPRAREQELSVPPSAPRGFGHICRPAVLWETDLCASCHQNDGQIRSPHHARSFPSRPKRVEDGWLRLTAALQRYLQPADARERRLAAAVAGAHQPCTIHLE